jgi:glutamate racemase
MNNPIGVFDSGVGGLSVLKEIEALLPNESVIYYADTANCPYGAKTQDEVIRCSEKVTRFLINKKCKLIVIACNTATSMAITHLRNTFDIPFIGIVPAVKPAVINSKTGVIAILATTGTLKSKIFSDTKEQFAGNTEIILVEANDLVEIVENRLQGTQQAQEALSKHIMPLLKKNIDHLVLGCTHFPFLIEDIKNLTGDSVVLDNPAPAVAKRTEFILKQKGLAASANNNRQTEFFSSGNVNVLLEMVHELF